MMNDFDKTMREGMLLANQLISSPPLYFKSLTPSDIPEDAAGVYAIFNDLTKETLYVGRTKNLRRRLYTNHLHGPKANARLKKYLVEDESQDHIRDMADAKQYLKDYCYVKYIREDDTVRRGRIEGLFSYLFDVKYIHEEH